MRFANGTSSIVLSGLRPFGPSARFTSPPLRPAGNGAGKAFVENCQHGVHGLEQTQSGTSLDGFVVLVGVASKRAILIVG